MWVAPVVLFSNYLSLAQRMPLDGDMLDIVVGHLTL